MILSLFIKFFVGLILIVVIGTEIRHAPSIEAEDL